MPARDILKPPPLRRGDIIGIVAPASNIKPEELEIGVARLTELGYQVVLGDYVYDRDLYFAGSVEDRARDLRRMFERRDVRAIICARGGYGANYLLPHIDVDVIRRNPKIFVGYSDITCLLTWITDETGLVAFHGPMAAKDFAHEGGIELESWFGCMEGKSSFDLTIPQSLAIGDVEGELYGGCLSILAASLGTNYEFECGDTILFLEDIGARPYQIDRMLMQLKYAGKLEGVRGIVFGDMLDCTQPGGQDYTLQDVILRVVGDLGVPVAFGLPSGHVRFGNITLPLGVRARLRVAVDSAKLTILESAVSSASI